MKKGRNNTPALAVTLEYPPDAPAPFITGIGKGHIAERMVEIATEHNIPQFSNPDVASILSVQEIGTMIPEETYEILAGIFAFIYKISDTESTL